MKISRKFRENLELELVGTIVAINMEPLTLEYESYDDFIYNLDFKFTTTTYWRATRVNTDALLTMKTHTSSTL